MSTNAIGTGTRNLSVNCPVDEHATIGRLAVRLGFKSSGHLSRYLMLKGLEQVDPEAARNVREIRKRYYGAGLLVVFLAAIFCGHDELRRSGRRVRVEEPIEERAEV